MPPTLPKPTRPRNHTYIPPSVTALPILHIPNEVNLDTSGASLSATAVRESQDRQIGAEKENGELENDYYTSPPGLSPTSSVSWEDNNYQTLEITVNNANSAYNSLDLHKTSTAKPDCCQHIQRHTNTESKIYWNERFYQPLISSTRDSTRVYNTTET